MAEERNTKLTRVFDDTLEMMGWILKLEGAGETSAEFLEPLIRPEVERRFEPLRDRVEQIKSALRGPQRAHAELGEAGA